MVVSILVLFSGRSALRGIETVAAHGSPREQRDIELAVVATMEEP